MKTIHFAVIGKNESILTTLVRVITKNEGWSAFGCSDVNALFDYLSQTEVAIVLLSSGLDTETESQIKSQVSQQYPNIKVIEHYGGGSGLLQNEVYEALANN